MAIRPTFDSRQKFVVMRQFKFAGRTFVAGKEFPWRSIGCSVRRLRQMYDARKLNMKHSQEEVSEKDLMKMEPKLQPMDKVVVEKVEVIENTDSTVDKAEDGEDGEGNADTSEGNDNVDAPLTEEQLAEQKAIKKARRKAHKAAQAAAGGA